MEEKKRPIAATASASASEHRAFDASSLNLSRLALHVAPSPVTPHPSPPRPCPNPSTRPEVRSRLALTSFNRSHEKKSSRRVPADLLTAEESHDSVCRKRPVASVAERTCGERGEGGRRKEEGERRKEGEAKKNQSIICAFFIWERRERRERGAVSLTCVLPGDLVDLSEIVIKIKIRWENFQGSCELGEGEINMAPKDPSTSFVPLPPP
ncbi:hypothetical protein B7494_g3067 [Chlorociboria aeruginascens]|nr:hypothetical protein B7494_g3067 [Chlorociboria aeruginascens]